MKLAEGSPTEKKTLGNGQIAHYEQFLLFPQYFQRLQLQTCKNQGLFEKGLTSDFLDPYHTIMSNDCYGRPLLQALLLPDFNTIPNNCVGENSL